MIDANTDKGRSAKGFPLHEGTSMTITKSLAKLARHAAAAALLCATASAPAIAQAYPSKPVRLIVPAPPGGTMDVVARLFSDDLAKALGQPVIIDNKAGGVGMIGVQDLLNSPRDGHSIMIHISGIASEIPYLTKPSYDPFKDIKPVAELMRSGLVLVGGPQLPVKTLPELIAHIKANPGKLNYASYTAGTISHTLGAELAGTASLDMTHVGYKGSPPALQDLMGGHVAMMFDGPVTSAPLIKADKIKAFAVTTPNRLAALPDVPTLAELGYPKMTTVAWVGLWTTPDAPPAVQAKIREAALAAIENPATRAKLAAFGVEIGSKATPEALSAALKEAYERQGAVLKSINFKPE